MKVYAHPRSALTLVEVLLATALLSMLALSLTAWLQSSVRVTAIDKEAMAQQQVEASILRLLRRDLAAASATPSVDKDGVLTLASLHCLPGETPSHRQLRWFWDDDSQTLQRESSWDRDKQRRAVYQGPPRVSFQTADEQVYMQTGGERQGFDAEATPTRYVLFKAPTGEPQ